MLPFFEFGKSTIAIKIPYLNIYSMKTRWKRAFVFSLRLAENTAKQKFAFGLSQKQTDVPLTDFCTLNPNPDSDLLQHVTILSYPQFIWNNMRVNAFKYKNKKQNIARCTKNTIMATTF